MGDADDAAADAAARFDFLEQGQAALQTKFDTISNQLQLLLNAPRGNIVPPTPNNTTLPSEILDAIANHIRLKRNVTNCHRKTPIITLDLRTGSARAFTAVTSAIPDPGAEVSVAGLDVLNSLGLAETDLSGAKYDLVQADRSSTLLSIGQLELTVRYGAREAQCTVALYPKNRRRNLSAKPVRPSWLTSTSFSTSPRAYAVLTDQP
ncbi:uncharacterized protein LOC123467548 [Daphnia magna]|uniref:uncharacterized protein LOC123467548 n=1 Tax=Daphnia magna TaxID=35525 RepID=UPI001E1BB55E|nr:uncharacterized protein LOC123467548 [Daphnia magna]